MRARLIWLAVVIAVVAGGVAVPVLHRPAAASASAPGSVGAVVLPSSLRGAVAASCRARAGTGEGWAGPASAEVRACVAGYRFDDTPVVAAPGAASLALSVYRAAVLWPCLRAHGVAPSPLLALSGTPQRDLTFEEVQPAWFVGDGPAQLVAAASACPERPGG